MERKATAVWHGNLQNGIGHISTESQTLKNTPYSFSTRFESDLGTNPEELIAAAHASCFTMALAAALGKEGIHADSLETSAVVSLKKNGENFTIASSKLRLRASVSDIDAKTFQKLAEFAKTNCPVSKALNTEVSLDVDFHATFHGSLSSH